MAISAKEQKVPTPPTTIPTLTWISGKIHQILLQDKENFYVVTLEGGHQARFGDPYTARAVLYPQMTQCIR
jgi:hypothetical protein